MLTEKDYCDLESTKALESLGMNVYTSFCGVEVLKHLLLYEAQKWLREEKHLHVEVTMVVFGKYYMFEIYDTETATLKRFIEEDFDSYEEALLEGIKEAVKILKEK